VANSSKETWGAVGITALFPLAVAITLGLGRPEPPNSPVPTFSSSNIGYGDGEGDGDGGKSTDVGFCARESHGGLAGEAGNCTVGVG
jgi:hypothetical protein